MHIIHRLAWDPYARGGPGQLPGVSIRSDGTTKMTLADIGYPVVQTALQR
jgi:hypothetical protein